MGMPQWVVDNFPATQRIARRHDNRCRLRVAMVTGNAELVCNCEGSIHGEAPRERTLDDVRRQISKG